MAYSEDYEFPYNNYLFNVQLATPALSSSFPGTQPGTTKAPPAGISCLVIKLSNLAAEGMNNTNRVQNDVAAQYLARQSMAQAGLAPLVPAIYAWAPATTTDPTNEKGFGWIMSEFKSGTDLDSEFPFLEPEDKELVLEQIAAILGAIQATRLPETVTKFGALTIDSNGRIVSGESPLLEGEPVGSYAEWRLRKLYIQFEHAAKSPIIQGWKLNGVDSRIEKFLNDSGPEKVLAGVDLHQKSLIHDDFSTYTLCYDSQLLIYLL